MPSSAQDRPHICLLVLHAACCFCSLLQLHASAAAAAAAGMSCCCTTVASPASSSAADVARSVHFPNKNPIFKPFSFPIMRIAEGLQISNSTKYYHIPCAMCYENEIEVYKKMKNVKL